MMGCMDDARPDPTVTLLLRDLYRLGRRDEPEATRLFQELVRSGYSYGVHRSVVLALEPHVRRPPTR